MQPFVVPGPDGTPISAPRPRDETPPKRSKHVVDLPLERRPASWIMTAYKV